jgi:raffinose/stachyose/melibiose transport system permease protein
MNRLYRNKLAIVLFLLPALILLIGIIVIPIIMTTYYSLHDWNGYGEMKFIGLGNYIELFTNKTVNFPQALLNAIYFAGLSIFIQLPFSLLLALLLAKGRKGSRFFLSVFFIPVIMSTVVIGQLWLRIYNPEYGILNVALRSIGLDSWTKVWLGDRSTALIAAFIPTLWQYTGYHMLLMYAGIRSLPPEVKEAALIDGASEWQVNRKIIIPMLRPVIRVCAIISITGSLKVFDLIYILTNGGPAHATEVPSTLMVNMMFLQNRFGFASAIAVLLIILCFFFAVVMRKALRTEVD